MTSKVQILLSTYNGEKYLREQLDSLLTQSSIGEIKITARDDGSTDGTRAILEEYENRGLNIVLGENIGLNASMLELLRNSDKNSDYFAFCDQDDVWGRDKIASAVEALDKLPKNQPLLWGCMEELTDEKLGFKSMMPAPKYLGDFYNAIIQNKLAGHTQVFNAALRNLLLEVPADKMYMYDWMAYILASAFGKVIFETRCLGKYRQHGNNAVGYELSPLAQIPRRLKRLKTGAFKLIALQISYFYEIFGARLDEASKKELKRLLGGLSSFPKRLNYALTTKVKRNTRFESLQFRALYVLGAYGKTEINDTNSTNMKRGGN